MKKIGSKNLIYMTGAILPNMAAALANHGSWWAGISAASIAVGFFIPCRDKTFGDGRPYHWVRQSLFAGFTALAVLCCLWP